jgi:energy-coupling factor transporter ATP-binding protein EcfA2
MIESLVLENFRCFRQHEIPFREKTIIVGRNNAGKSSIVEALRLVTIIAERCSNALYVAPPNWSEIHKSNRGISPSLDGQAFNFERVFHRHNDPPAIVTCNFEGGASVTVYIGRENSIHGVIRSSRGHIVTTKSEARAVNLPTVAVLPQVAPVRAMERVIEEDRVRQFVLSALAPLHFRNQLLVFKEYFNDFKKISEETWHGLAIGELEKFRQGGETFLRLMIRNEDFAADVSWMGHGLQMWLQTMWFLARCKGYETIILDEPDVYMHADLQRKLIRFVRDRHPQVIIATHSVEIMAEVDPEEVLVVDKDKRAAEFAADLPEVQQIISQIGGIHNLQLARMVSSKRCIFVEGDDLNILKRFQNTAVSDSEYPIDGIPHLSIGGWGGWNYVIGSSMWVQSTMQDVSKYCVFDRDYHTAEQIRSRLEEADKKGIRLKIWNKKELENYLLVPSAISRLLGKLGRGRKNYPDEVATRSKLEEIAENLKDTVIGGIADEIPRATGMSASTAYNVARTKVAETWNTFNGKMTLISGKEALTALNRWCQDNFKISFTTVRLASELRLNEIDPEVQNFLSAIEFNEAF